MLSRRQSLRCMAHTGLLAAVGGQAAFAATFLNLAQAQALLLPQALVFQPHPLALDAARVAALAEATQTAVPRGYAPQCWLGLRQQQAEGWVLIDHVVGKYDWIDYAMGFDGQARARGLEIMAYRESHGAEIRNAAWRQQFAGRSGAAQLRMGDDIRNISGATLSCQHVTQGAQRLAVIAQWLATSPAQV